MKFNLHSIQLYGGFNSFSGQAAAMLVSVISFIRPRWRMSRTLSSVHKALVFFLMFSFGPFNNKRLLFKVILSTFRAIDIFSSFFYWSSAVSVDSWRLISSWVYVGVHYSVRRKWFKKNIFLITHIHLFANILHYCDIFCTVSHLFSLVFLVL